jgi:5-formyltetrahydrofolate cyclo-ligase
VSKRGVDPGPTPPHSHALAPEEVIRVKVKAELRKRLRGVRKTMPASAVAERSGKIVAALAAHDAVARANTVALFWPIEARHEVDLRALDAMLRARSARVAYPSIDPDSGEMVLRYVDDVAGLGEAGYGFAEPPKEAPEASDVEVIVVPAIAIDPTGHRIGYGAGYYDRTLPKYPRAVTIAVGYDWQLVAEVPVTEGDVACGWVVTDSRVIEVGRSS